MMSSNIGGCRGFAGSAHRSEILSSAQYLASAMLSLRLQTDKTLTRDQFFAEQGWIERWIISAGSVLLLTSVRVTLLSCTSGGSTLVFGCSSGQSIYPAVCWMPVRPRGAASFLDHPWLLPIISLFPHVPIPKHYREPIVTHMGLRAERWTPSLWDVRAYCLAYLFTEREAHKES